MIRDGEQYKWKDGPEFRQSVVNEFDPDIVHWTKLLDSQQQHGVYRELTGEVCYVQLTCRKNRSHTVIRCMGSYGARELMNPHS